MAAATLSLMVGSPASTIVALTPVSPWGGAQGSGFIYPQASIPAPAGSVVASISVIPANWSGTLSLSGASAALFAILGTNLIVGATPLFAGSYTVVVTATP